MKIPLVDLHAQYLSISAEIQGGIEKVLLRGDFILGENVTQFETAFSEFCGTDHTISVASGTDALHLTLLGLGIGPGDEVITTPNSFVSTASAITFCGAKPVFADVDDRTGTIDPPAVLKTITAKTRAIVPVHLYGHPADMDALLAISNKYGIPIVEDACQAHGARYKGRRVGSIGEAAAFSFYPSKNLGCYGDGGAVTTNNAELADRIMMLRNYGQAEKYKHDLLAFNSRLDTIQAAVLHVKLKYLEEWNARRRKAAAFYEDRLKDSGVTPPGVSANCEPVFYLYGVRTKTRNDLLKKLQSEGIGAAVHYPIPIHLQKVYSGLGHRSGDFPVSEKWCAEVLSLPMFPEITEEQIERVCSVIREFVPLCEEYF